MLGHEPVAAGIAGPEVTDNVFRQIGGAFRRYHGVGTNGADRQITPAGEVTTIAGTVNTPGSTNGPGFAALFNLPTGIAISHLHNELTVADYGSHTIRRVSL